MEYTGHVDNGRSKRER